IAEIGEERRHFRFLPLRARGYRVGFVKQIARTEDCEMRVGEHDAVRNVGFRERCGVDLAREVTGLIRITLAAAGAASQAETRVVFREDVGETLDFTRVRD